MLTDFSALILVGGNSRRMGQDKATLLVEGERLVDRQIRIAKEAGASEIWIAGRATAPLELPGFLPDAEEDLGPMGGILSGLTACRTPFLLVIAVDLAWLRSDWLNYLTHPPGVVPFLESQPEPLCASYPVTTLPIARAFVAEGRLAARAFAEACCTQGFCRRWEIADEEGKSALRNCNWPGDLQDWSQGSPPRKRVE